MSILEFTIRSQSVRMLALILATALSAFAQVESGRFVGRTTDAQGAVVPNATIKATNVRTNIVKTAITNSIGDFVITPVGVGIYSLNVSAAGFETTTTSNVEVQVR